MNIRQQKLPIETLEKIDDLCAQFEKSWQSDQPITIESLLQSHQFQSDQPELERSVLLAELIVLEVDYRKRRGEKPNKLEYQKRFQDDLETIDGTFEEPVKTTHPFQAPSPESLAPLFPKLQIECLIGAGGMGAVYRARQTGLDRIVALKILPEEFGHDVKFAMRFTREARTLAKLNHPNIVSVFEFGNVKDTYYFLMEYVEGTTLREIVSSQHLEPPGALKIIPHLCDALQYAHDQGVIHRDIKPENILIDVEGTVKIVDFGLSRILGTEDQPALLTGTHQVMGTPRYMAPEQLEGSKGVDHRADIYSLGVVFYEMLTGELPIGRFANPSQKVQIDVRLDEVVLRSLEKEPQKRYQFASEIKSDVQSIVSTRTQTLAPTEIHTRKQSSSPEQPISLQEQEIAGRLLLTRRQLMERVKGALSPLFRGQVVQIFVGIGLIALGVFCWAPNTHIPHRLACGLILHLYGMLVIAAGGTVCNKVSKLDFSQPVKDVREAVKGIRTTYLRFGHIIGLPWWLMWIPVCVAFGFDQVLHPNALYPSLAICGIGFIASFWLYFKFIWAQGEKREKYQSMFGSQSIQQAFTEIKELEDAKIE